MKTIWKIELGYPTQLPSHKSVPMPVDFEVLKVGRQKNQLVMWILVEVKKEEDGRVSAELKPRKVFFYGTGNEIQPGPVSNQGYLDTVLYRDGNHVIHIFLEK